MCFPFLVSKVKCGNKVLDVAGQQNAHSASVAVSSIVELYRAVSLQDELHQSILAFLVSHNHEAVQIYGHYVSIEGAETRFYSYSIREFNFTEQDGKEKWVTYKFIRNVYYTFIPIHVKRIYAAADLLLNPEVFLVETPRSQSNAGPIEQDDSRSTVASSQESVSMLPSSQTSGQCPRSSSSNILHHTNPKPRLGNLARKSIKTKSETLALETLETSLDPQIDD